MNYIGSEKGNRNERDEGDGEYKSIDENIHLVNTKSRQKSQKNQLSARESCVENLTRTRHGCREDAQNKTRQCQENMKY